MNSVQRQIIHDTFNASNEGRMHFGEVVGRLMEAGVESYAVDYRGRHTTYHLTNDETVAIPMAPSAHGVAATFSATEVQAAIRGAQQGSVSYPEFKRLSMQAGCVGYIVWIAGRHVAYYGRKGETHIERFPD